MQKIKNKYSDAVIDGILPLSFLFLYQEDPESNHELVDKSTFSSAKFNNKRMSFSGSPIALFLNVENDSH